MEGLMEKDRTKWREGGGGGIGKDKRGRIDGE